MCNRIIVNSISFNGLHFLGNPNARIPGGFLCVKEFGFFEQPTSIDKTKYAFRHGSYIGVAKKDNRTFKLLFDIIAEDEQQRRELMKKVKIAFSPESNPSPFNPNLRKKLSFIDPVGKQWETEVQVNQGGSPQLSDFANDQRVGISTELIGRTVEVYASIMQSLDDTNHTFGVAIPTNVPFKMSYKDTLITHTELATPLNVEITVKKEGAIVGDTLTVYHRNDYDTGYLSFNHLTTKQGDKIEIDSINQLAYLLHNGNKTDITGLISLSSSRPYLNYGTNLVAVDCGVKHPVLDVVWKWREVF